MQRFLILFCLVWAISPCGADWIPLFNGKNLDGWSGDSRLWRVEDGVIIGETDEKDRKIEKNSFLIWQGGEPEDFELEFQARLTGGSNSGVQYRSRVIDAKAWLVGGYQLDLLVDSAYLGMLYEEDGRGIACQRGQRVKLGNTPNVTGSLEVTEANPLEWNSYRIVAQGYGLRHFINDKLVAEIQDMQPDKRSVKGVVALQLHKNRASKVEFRNMRIRMGDKTDCAGAPAPVWIWDSATAEENGKVFFRREFQLPPKIASASLTLICDDSHRLFINGQNVGGAGGWSIPHQYDVLPHLKPGSRNMIAVEGVNVRGNAGLLLRFRATQEDGRMLHIVSDNHWRCSNKEAEGWLDVDFLSTDWPKAVVVAKMGEAAWAGVILPEAK